MENEVVSKLELKVLGGKGPDKTKYIVNVANQFFSDRKILLFSLETPKTLLKPNYNLQESDNIIVIDMLTKIEEIESYLAIEKPNYLLIDSIQLLKTDKEFLNVQDKIKYNGMTVMRIGTINQFLQSEPSYIKGKLIRLESVKDDYHMIKSIAEELYKGVLI